MKSLFQILTRSGDDQFITIVSGLPRSGTSMMMKMVDAGGIPPLTDELRVADEDNPKGYYEFERVKQMDKGDTAWVPDARGKAVKVISALLKHLRGVEEWLASRRNVRTLFVHYSDMLGNPKPQIERVNTFLGGKLDTARMGEVVDPALYRNRSK